MKKLFLLLIVVAFITGCSKDEVVSPMGSDDVNLKDWVLTVPLMAGQHIDVGSVTYIDTEDGFFKITFNLTGGWTMEESHVFAGKEKDMPVNKPGAPKIGKFPYKATHNPEVTTYTYTVPAGDHADFVLASHCVVNHPSQGNETGWATGNKTFSDKGWGTYLNNFYGQSSYVANIFYGIVYNTDGTLTLVYIDGDAGTGDIIFEETIATGGTVDAAAYDPNTGDLFFVIGNTLYVNNLNGNDPTHVVGILSGIANGGTFLNGNYYYVDADPNSANYNEIIEVTLVYDPATGTWSLSENTNYSSAMSNTDIVVTDIATDGNFIYIVGVDDNGTPNDYTDDNTYLVSFNIGDGSFSPLQTTQLNGAAQIAFGSDGNLYAIDINDNGEDVLVILDPSTGDTGDEESIIITDPDGGTVNDGISDIAIGPATL